MKNNTFSRCSLECIFLESEGISFISPNCSIKTSINSRNRK